MASLWFEPAHGLLAKWLCLFDTGFPALFFLGGCKGKPTDNPAFYLRGPGVPPYNRGLRTHFGGLKPEKWRWEAMAELKAEIEALVAKISDKAAGRRE